MTSRPDDGVLRFGGGPGDASFVPDPSNVSAMMQTFFQWLATVWVEQNRVPTSPDELAQFDIGSLIPEYRAYIDAGGRVDTEHGITLEQDWLMAQLPSREAFVCLINRLQPPTPCERITRKEFMDGGQIIEVMQRILGRRRGAKAKAQQQSPELLPTNVYDGDRMAHAIITLGIDAATNSFIFQDPWPGRSLLCAENNAAGVAAVPAPRGPPLWMVKPEEMEAVVFSVFVPLDVWQQRRRNSN